MARFPVSYLKARFQLVAKAMNWNIANPRWTSEPDGRNQCTVGHVALEKNSVYGWNINQAVNQGGGERRVLESCTAAELDAWMSGVLYAKDTYRH